MICTIFFSSPHFQNFEKKRISIIMAMWIWSKMLRLWFDISFEVFPQKTVFIFLSFILNSFPHGFMVWICGVLSFLLQQWCFGGPTDLVITRSWVWILRSENFSVRNSWCIESPIQDAYRLRECQVTLREKIGELNTGEILYPMHLLTDQEYI